MRIAIEAGALRLTSGGLARYTAELSLALARTFPADEVLLISDQEFRMPEGAPPNLKRGGGPRNAAERRWWLWGITREMARLGAEVIHGPDFAVPYLARHPSVLTLHDLSPWTGAPWRQASGRVTRRTPLLLELGIATMVVTPAESVRGEAMERFRLRPDRVVAIPEAPAPWIRRVERNPESSSIPYFLFVGALEARKNLETVVEAWRVVRLRHPVNLVLAGRKRPGYLLPAEEPGLTILGEVPDSDLPALYSGALAFVYSSFYEGFGLPVLEAMQCGVPVIASPAVKEAAGDAALYATSVSELAEAMSEVAKRPDLAAGLRERSLSRAGQFTWERTAALTREVYVEARRRFGS